MEPTLKPFDADAFCSAVKSDRRPVRYQKKEVIFSQGYPNGPMFYVEKGHVKLWVVSAQGKEAILSVFNGGTFFGESCTDTDEPVRIHGVVALTEVDLARIERAAIISLLRVGARKGLGSLLSPSGVKPKSRKILPIVS